MQVGLMAPQGWKGEYDGWAAADAWDRTIELAQQAEALGFEALWVFDHFHTVPAPDRRDHVRVVLRPGRAGDGDRARPARSHGHLRGLPQPRAHGQDVLDDRRHQRRPVRARDRRRLEGRGVAGVRLSASRRSPSGWARSATSSRSSGRCSVRAGRPTRAATRTFAARSTCPKGIQQPRIPIIVGGNGKRVTVGLRDPLRGRAQLRLPRRPRRSPSGWYPFGRAARRRVGILRRSVSRSIRATRRCATRARQRVDTLAGFAAVGLDRIVCFPDALVADGRGTGGVR